MDKVTKQKKAYQILIDVFEKDLWHDLKRDTDKSKRLSHEDKRLLKVYVDENYEKVISSDYPYSLLFEAFYHKMPIRFADFLNVAQQIRVYYQSIWMPAQKDWQLETLFITIILSHLDIYWRIIQEKDCFVSARQPLL